MTDVSPKKSAGDISESRFFQAILHDEGPKPDWFVNVARASTKLDMHGIDAIAYLRYPEFDDLIRVPIQIKTSPEQKEGYYQKDPEAARARVVIIHTLYFDAKAKEWRWLNEDMLCRQLYRELGEVWRDRRLYDGFIEKRMQKPLDERWESFRKSLDRRRRSKLPRTKMIKDSDKSIKRTWNRFLARLRA